MNRTRNYFSRRSNASIIPPVAIMIVSLAIYWLSGPKASGREP